MFVQHQRCPHSYLHYTKARVANNEFHPFQTITMQPLEKTNQDSPVLLHALGCLKNLVILSLLITISTKTALFQMLCPSYNTGRFHPHRHTCTCLSSKGRLPSSSRYTLITITSTLPHTNSLFYPLKNSSFNCIHNLLSPPTTVCRDFIPQKSINQVSFY